MTFLLMAMPLGWWTGCTPKPTNLYEEPPQPIIPIVAVETDKGAETDKEILPPEDQSLPADTGGSAPAVASTPSPNVEEAHLIHKVQWGHETLYTIALWYTGKGYHWRRIAAANPGIKPRRMRIGNTVRIPGALLKTRRPMPPDYQRPAPRRSTKSTEETPSKPPEPVQTPPLYGPVGDEPSERSEESTELSIPLETLDE